jgi:2-C-methyl-D-erythritol 4-phosphate cytidylyltransferase/2-C-methyl-D-erythritol 2,4-cyclodiphosphate synthase
MTVAAIVAAAGQGRRLGESLPKQFVRIGDRTLLERSVDAFVRHPAIDEVVVVLPAGASPPPSLSGREKPVTTVTGGDRRQDSVAAGFAAVTPSVDLIVIHDAARPFVDPATIGRTIAAARECGAAIAALPASDTVKEAGSEAPPAVARTLPREGIWLAQTPQAFARRVLADAIRLGQSGATGTDEAALAEQAGHTVRLVEGDSRNIKVTTAADLAYARAIVADEHERAGTAEQAQVGGPWRIGTGYDSHRLIEGRRLLLGGVLIPYSMGLKGHSDGDALCHAVTDAVLGAAALGDIGRHFPDSDERWRDANSIVLLEHAVALVHAAGFVVGNVDAVVVAERPALAPHVERIRGRLAQALRVDPSVVSVKGKTNEGMGETGRGEGIVVHAVALLVRRSSAESMSRI